MNGKLTKEIIQERTNGQSYQRGQSYYRAGSIYNRRFQSLPNGLVLTARCEGNSAPFYRLSVVLDEGGVRSSSCTCPYDWGGDCKHLVALLLTYLNEPGTFTEQKSIVDLLSGMDKDALMALILRLVERDPDLYDQLEKAIPVVQVSLQINAADPLTTGQAQVTEQTYRELVKQILSQRSYDVVDDDYDEYDEYYDDFDSEENTPAFLENLEKIWQTANQLLERGDCEGCLTILRVLLEETVNAYESETDGDGELGSFIESIGMAITETILTREIDEKSRNALQEAVPEILPTLDGIVNELYIKLILLALDYGWKELPDKNTQHDQFNDEMWQLFARLEITRLDILDRQGRIDEFLQLAQKIDPNRYLFKLLQLGHWDKLIMAGQELTDENILLTILNKLREAGRMDDAIALAERCFNRPYPHKIELLNWLAPVEEAQGNMGVALRAYRMIFDADPSMILFRKLKKLSGPDWESLRPVLMDKFIENSSNATLADLYLEEHDWNFAIAIAEKSLWDTITLEKVTDAVLPHRPDWVISVSIRQAERLINTVQSNQYPAAAGWLSRAKKAYQAKGHLAEWQTYIEDLREKYLRRPALQHALAGL